MPAPCPPTVANRRPPPGSPRGVGFRLSLLFALGFSACAAELHLDFGAAGSQGLPPGFRSTVTGEGPPGVWRVLHEEIDRDSARPRSSVTVQHPVLAQLSDDPTDERFPLLIYEPLVFDDFTFTTRFRIVGGRTEQMAGIAFRVRDEKNYYVLRASALGNSFLFYKFVDGIRSTPVGVSTTIPTNTWLELSVQCAGNQIRCRLDGRELFPALTDNTFTEGRIGFWTKSDSISHFRDAHISYRPRENPAVALLREAMEKYPNLAGLRICARPTPGDPPQIIASHDPSEVGRPAGEIDSDVLEHGHVYYGKDKKISEVAMPLRDRNGDAVASVRVLLRRRPLQTQAGNLARARPILDFLQSRIQSIQDLIRP